ncbi:MAG: hypothetical protein AAFV71_09000 [Cyanobacteria bacterium J06633_8]
MAELLKFLSDKINQDGEKDLSRNRVKLAACLKECSLELSEASTAIDKAWEICEPYCQEELKEDTQ